MEFTTTNEIIKELESITRGENRSWIYDEDGNIKEGIYIVDVIECLRNIIDNEVDKDSDMFADIYGRTMGFTENIEYYNTYNANGNCSHCIEYDIVQTNSLDGLYVRMMFHRFGDVRGNYTDYVLYRFEDWEEMLDAFISSYRLEEDDIEVWIDCSAFHENNYVSGKYGDEEIFGDFYECEKEDLIKVIKEEYA